MDHGGLDIFVGDTAKRFRDLMGVALYKNPAGVLSDEGVGVRKYYADPEKGNNELALFAKTGFADDHEGISIYKTGPKTGYLLVSDQGANQFHIFRREGEPGHPNDYKLLKIVKVAAQVSGGSDVTNVAFWPHFPHGLFVAMSEGKTFHYYRWEDLAGKDLK